MPYRTSPETELFKQAKRRLILDTAANIFAQKGYHGTSVKDIVDSAQISVGSFYFYFSTKDDLFEALYDEMNDAFLDVLQSIMDLTRKNAILGICQAITCSLQLFTENKLLSRLFIIDTAGITPRFEQKRKDNLQRFLTILDQILTEMVQNGQIICENTRLTALVLLGGLYQTMIGWQDNDEYNLADVCFLACCYHLRALGVNYDPEYVKEYIGKNLKGVTI